MLGCKGWKGANNFFTTGKKIKSVLILWSFTTHMIKMLHDISWQPIFSFDENFNNFVEWERTDFKDFNHPRESPNSEIITKKEG